MNNLQYLLTIQVLKDFHKFLAKFSILLVFPVDTSFADTSKISLLQEAILQTTGK